MIADRIGDCWINANGQRQITADLALQFGKLSHRGGDEIGLSQPRGLFGLRRITRHRAAFAQPLGQRRYAFDLVGHCAQFLVEHDIVQLGQECLQPAGAHSRQILFPEEARIRQSRRQHALIAIGDGGAAIIGVQIGDADEGRRQRARRVGQREIFLIGAHRQHDHFARHRQKIRIEPAQQRHRPFGQPGIFRH